MNSFEQNTDGKLGFKHQIAIDLRLLGYKYHQIASNPQIALKEHTVRTWFMKEWVCYNDYKLRKNQKLKENKRLFDEIYLQLEDISLDAITTLRNAISNGNINASYKILQLFDIKRLIILSQQRQGKEDEGILLLREIVTDIRRQAKLERLKEDKQIQSQ